MLHNPAIHIYDSTDERGDLFELLEPLCFELPPRPPLWLLKRRFTVPVGFKSDGASVPRFLWRLLSPRIDPITLAPSIAHDWLYTQAGRRDLTRGECDSWYRDALILRGYPRWKSQLTYIGVRLFGGRHWEAL